MRKYILMIVILSCVSILLAQKSKPIGHWAFDNVKSELKELEMVRGETFLPKERCSCGWGWQRGH